MRPLALIVVVAAHMALLVLLATENRTVKRQPHASKSQLVFVPDRRRAEPRLRIAPPEMTTPRLQLQDPFEPPDAATPVVQPAAPPATIDWAKEAELSGSRQIATAEAARRAAEMFTKRPPVGDEPLFRPTPEFGWLHSSIQPIEAVPEGGFIIWLNERCGIFVSVLAMPFCGFGEIPARGDLFEHMSDAPRPGDWKD